MIRSLFINEEGGTLPPPASGQFWRIAATYVTMHPDYAGPVQVFVVDQQSMYEPQPFKCPPNLYGAI